MAIPINRRRALNLMGMSSLSVALLPQVVLPGCSPVPHPYPLFTHGDTAILNAIAEILLPKTPDSAGATEANVGDFVQLYVSDCMNLMHQNVFLEGYTALKEDLKARFNNSLDELDELDRINIVKELIDSLEIESGSPSFFSLLKSTILRGYFTSEKGMKESLAYLPVPGYQQGVTNLETNQKSWAI